MTIWNTFAKTNPYYYIDTNYKGSEPRFWQNGIKQSSLIMEYVGSNLQQKRFVLEFGCGVGRVLLPMANNFEQAIGVDISSEMLKLLAQQALKQNKNNIESYSITENWHQHKFDLVYSILTFQHIKDYHIIESSIQQIADCLNKKGIAYLHFDTRRTNWRYKLKNRLPNWLLPKNNQPGIRRIRRDRKDLVKLFKKNKLKLIKELNPNSAHNFFILKK
ncbi:class I SAM-dependent methyltransferase [Candidatus Falkowbacteria bacterium]|jgi:cyclopropane fatty-acyl-phospholipid synthase-like methyltransferase|nr:class I SAM-dependent methyltransferase [Candidatus Falkowbacteria bacterium]MBT5502947.1 class I SAM-dependent methyltransferase [Candidatus Falkowbacteria bacterium]MBT6574210.1 class I SAM-dependent methyltransferase [Candidatus Falkowbacteria bacterium]MBT7348642.1 class I SAM-dependent methyltransferase [Candidatus Falkowbacteria bacterium]MBT7500433.1 class I SAM-dependent methyltransferase [Candidatus Falkowbacteria bacterium]